MNKKLIMDGFQFEQLVADLLISLGFINVAIGDNHDSIDYDIQAICPSKSPNGVVIPQLWLVEVKYRRSERRISSREIRQMLRYLEVNEAHKALFVTSGNLTSVARETVAKYNEEYDDRLEVWDRDKLTSLLNQFPEIQKRYYEIIADFPHSLDSVDESSESKLIERLSKCVPGGEQWREYERICIEILTSVFVPPLKPPREQARTRSGLERRDALFSLRRGTEGWSELRREFDAHFLLCEFKNYSGPVSKDEVNQTRNYLKSAIGRIGVIFSRNGFDEGARNLRNSIYGEEKKVILFFEDKHLIELIKLKLAGQNPLELLQDAIDDFYMAHE